MRFLQGTCSNELTRRVVDLCEVCAIKETRDEYTVICLLHGGESLSIRGETYDKVVAAWFDCLAQD